MTIKVFEMVSHEEGARLVGTIGVFDGKVGCRPSDDKLLKRMVTEPIFAGGKNVGPVAEPEEFVEGLPLAYHGTYLWCEEERVEEMEQWERDLAAEAAVTDLRHKWDESQHPREPAGTGEGGQFVREGEGGGESSIISDKNEPQNMSDDEQVLWKSATRNVPDILLQVADIQEFHIGRAPVTDTPGGYTFEGNIWVDGSDPQIALHEISHRIEFGLDNHADQKVREATRDLRISLRDNQQIKISPRERVAVAIECTYSDPGSRPREWIDKFPDVVSQVHDIEALVKGLE